MHTPVLYHEILSLLQPVNKGRYIDCTVGSGGHAWGILNASRPDGRLLGIDLDNKALDMAGEYLMEFSNRIILIHGSYTSLATQMQKYFWDFVDGVVLDLGVSSMQLDTDVRGFSFRSEAELDMRFDDSHGETAAQMINKATEIELEEVIRKFGEESRSRQIAKAIMTAKPVTSTKQLADIVARVSPVKRGAIHPATKTFQALRIAVNRELDSIEAVLPQAIAALRPSGRLAVIAYHSLEDRLIKNYFRREAKDCICSSSVVPCNCDHKAVINLVTKKPVRPTEQEVFRNPRSRSAKLRVVEKI